MTGFTPEEWRTAARVARRSIFTEGNPDLADAWDKAADQAEARLIPAGGMALTAEQVDGLKFALEAVTSVADASPELRRTPSTPISRLVKFLCALFPETEPAEVKGRDFLDALPTEPDCWDVCEGQPAPAEPAEEETKAEALQDVEVMQWDGTRKSIQAICDWVNNFDDELDDPTISYCFSSAAPDDVLDVSLTTNEGDFVRVSDGDFIVRDMQGNFYRRDRNAYTTVAASSPVVPAPAETEWPSLDAVPSHVRQVWDKFGVEYRVRVNGRWRIRRPAGEWAEITIPPASFDDYAPFTAPHPTGDEQR
jgi:hypothetical protein